MDLERLRELEIGINADLKDFQRATVDRIYDLFSTDKQQKVLLADEVGLGKTLVAKGVISRLARLYKEKDADSFQVVYICSNMSIARQNMEKLKIDDDVRADGDSVTRLSMQVLQIFEQRQKLISDNGFIHLTAMTPGTSFRLTVGAGIVTERALIYVLLKQTGLFDHYYSELEAFLSMDVKAWAAWAKNWLEDRVSKLDESYRMQIIERVKRYLIEEEDLGLLQAIKKKGDAIKMGESHLENIYGIIGRLRWMMARISLEFLKPDLVIMDEFQRFRDLITAEPDTEIGMLTNKFIHQEDVRTLLLSATPYKLYSTLEEIEEQGGIDEHYEEFRQVVNFLFRDKPQKSFEFKKTWNNYSSQLSLIEIDNLAILVASKDRAESLLYEALCRTERLKVSGTGDDMLDSSGAKEALDIIEEDIKSYLEADAVVEAIKARSGQIAAPVEYVKSSPYILSFMDDYQVKKDLYQVLKTYPDLKDVVTKNQRLWVRRNDINHYKYIKYPNARLRKLVSEAFSNNAEWLLWVPPSLPYYELGGPFQKSAGFSKILVFSAWVMVPRMIAALISYEAERKTIGLPSYKPDSEDEGKKIYFAKEKRRFPYPKLNFRVNRSGGNLETKPESMSLFTLLYPSLSLKKMFDPVEILNQRVDKTKTPTLKEVKQSIGNKMSQELDKLRDQSSVETGAISSVWYWATPILIDINNGKREYIQKWLDDTIKQRLNNSKERKGENLELTHLYYLRDLLEGKTKLKLGTIPDDLIDVLTMQVLGSPAVCVLRALLKPVQEAHIESEQVTAAMHEAYMLGRSFTLLFNRRDAISIVDQKYGKRFEEYHWRNVLRYCVDGNIQAVLDEFKHMLVESYGLKDKALSYQIARVSSLMRESMTASTASYQVDTLQSFLELDSDRKKISLRSHYAAGFFQVKAQDNKFLQRTDRLRSAFNSPFRPFVLATTSIGQEGLDFHYYCRKVMHWNIPSNPIDLEQREGRINRYKNLAIRQNVAMWYRSIVFNQDPWIEMFNRCKEEKQNDHCEIIPYWYVPLEDGNGEVVSIERIVPKYPYSRDEQQYERLVRMLSIYRISLGQARQEELLEYIMQNISEDNIDELNALFMNLSPFYRA